MNKYMEDRKEQGFTLIELLIAIVVVGILTAVAIVGIAGLTDKGSKSACNATRDATKAAIAVHFANQGSYPSDWQDLTAAVPQPELELNSGITPNPPADGDQTITGKGWTLTMGGGGASPTTLTNCP
jgi:general secretion pathway protein G